MKDFQAKVKVSFNEFKKLAKKHDLIPVYIEILADMETPVSTFLKVASRSPHAFLLESVEYGEKIGRYSFIGFKPKAIIESKGGKLYLSENGRKRIIGKDNELLQKLKSRLYCYKFAKPHALPTFCGGWVGYIGYENVKDFEDIRLRAKHGLKLPDAVFFQVDQFILFDHVERTLKIIVLSHVKGNLRRAYNHTLQTIDKTLRVLNKPIPPSRVTSVVGRERKLRSNLTKNGFESRVRRIKRYIRAGDAIQVVLSQRLDLGKSKNEFSIYRALRSINPSPYMFYFVHGSLKLIGSSPEMMVKKIGNQAELRPIAGTRHRGRTEGEDRKLENELLKSKKEMAEHLMLVDLGRNDLGRVCQFNSIKVSEFARIEHYSHVMHLVSDITGKLRKGKDAFDLLRASFPAGTVTGAPKIRAMEIVDELETEKRGPYAGSVGYFSFSGDMDMCITIRTIMSLKGHIYAQAGAGIVNDSKPPFEYNETLHKARALFQAVKKSKQKGS